jgi:hypothetical protein
MAFRFSHIAHMAGRGFALAVLCIAGMAAIAAPVLAAQNPLVVLTVVVDNAEGHPVADADVSVSGLSMSEYTTSQGKATFSGLSAGNYTITARSGNQTVANSINLGSTPSAQLTLAFNQPAAPTSPLLKIIGLFAAALVILGGGVWWASRLVGSGVPESDSIPARQADEPPEAPGTPPRVLVNAPAPSTVYRPGDPDGKPVIH